MFTKVSVLVPTRNRLQQLQLCLGSYYETAGCDPSAELIFRVDEDDPATERFLSGFGWPVLVGQKLNGYRSLPAFFEDMRRVATGDLFMCGNDDMVFRTPGWPALVLEAANQYPDGVFVLGVDTLNAGVFPFSIIARSAVDAIGFIHDARLTAGDVFLRDVMAHFGRAISLPSVRVDHHWQGYTPEHPVLDADYWALHRQCVAEAVSRLEVAHGIQRELTHG